MPSSQDRPPPSSGLELVAIGPDDSYLRFPLPEAGSLLIGRGSDAKLLGVARSTLLLRLDALQIVRPRKRGG